MKFGKTSINFDIGGWEPSDGSIERLYTVRIAFLSLFLNFGVDY